MRLNRAAGELNPFLVVLAIGLFILDVILYIGLSVAREPMIWMAPRQTGGVVAPANATPQYNTDVPGAGSARN